MNDLIPNVNNPFSENNKLILLEIYKDLAQPGVRKVGLAIETIFDLLNISLIHIKSFSEKRKMIFQNNMNKYREKIEYIDEDKICDIPPEIGVPAFERLTYTENKNISDLFINLLHKASNNETLKEVHPNYIKLIESLSPDEAKILCYLYNQKSIPFIKIKRKDINGQSFAFLTEPLTGIENLIPLLFRENIDLYMTNLSSLGIINCIDMFFKIDDNLYDFIKNIYKKRIEYYDSTIDKKKEILDIQKGYYEISTMGHLFMECCTNGDDEPEVFLSRADMKMRNKDFIGAIEDYSKALPLKIYETDKYEINFNRGTSFYHIEQYEESKNNFIESISLANDLKSKILSLSYYSLCIARIGDENLCLKILNEDIGYNKNIELYNISCTYSILYLKFNKEEYKNFALKYLEECLNNKTTTKKYVLEDNDWKHFQDDEDFKNILNKSK
ncbi:MAG: DUF4393 domain-containing protein [Ignavibacteriae bacterium]|nr:DUF4393 domain-containing protein [Ignavibacteriota bacterium]